MIKRIATFFLCVFLLQAIPVYAQNNTSELARPDPQERYGNWTVEAFGSAFTAYTKNSSGSTFGMLCGDKCYNVFNPQIACDSGDEYPALINSSAGAFNTTLTCIHYDDRNLLTMPFVDTMYNSMEIGGELGVAFPMADGKFQVVRFSLTGALKASVRAFNLSNASKNGDEDDDLKDQIL